MLFESVQVAAYDHLTMYDAYMFMRVQLNCRTIIPREIRFEVYPGSKISMVLVLHICMRYAMDVAVVHGQLTLLLC
jgi:hypothetical protein